jgi:two-component system LytT family response regulator
MMASRPAEPGLKYGSRYIEQPESNAMLVSIIVDDEQKSQENLQGIIQEFVEEISVVACCKNVAEAIEAVKVHKPDIVFLDIQMKGETGFDLLSKIDKIDFEIIFVTAYSEYAIKAIKFSAIDYLLKPIDIEELKMAIGKVAQRRTGKILKRLGILQDHLSNAGHDNSKIALPTSDGLFFIRIQEIIYCQASSSYTIFFTTDGKQHVVCRTLKEYEELLVDHNFFRIHHSYLVNLNMIKKYVKGDGGYVILNNDVSLDVSKRKKIDFLKRFSTAD